MPVLDNEGYVTTPALEYVSDPNLTLKKRTHRYQQNIAVDKYAFALSAADVKTNNYSNTILSRELKVDDILQVQPIERETKQVLNTYLAITLSDNITDNSKYLYFNNERETISDDFSLATSHQMVYLSGATYYDQTFFNIEMLTSEYARISYTYKDVKFYLAVNSTGDIVFATGYTDIDDINFNFIDETVFCYAIDTFSNSITFVKPLTGGVSRALGLSSMDSNRLQLLSAVNTSNYLIDNMTSFLIRSNIQDIDEKLNTSIASYVGGDILDINESKLIGDLSNNMLVFAQYAGISSNSIPIRILNLKNQSTNLGAIERSDYTHLLNSEPGVQSRAYTHINAGAIEQEGGFDCPHINYTFFSTDYIAKAGRYNTFKVGGTLYPYAQLNINSTSFIETGAFPGDTPSVSDNIFTSKAPPLDRDGQYLCTWLSGSNITGNSVWVDRYYHNNQITPLNALKAVNPTYGSYEYQTQSFDTNNNVDVPFYDKLSDLVFSSNQTYTYNRVGMNRLAAHLDRFANALVVSSVNWYGRGNQLISEESPVLTGSQYAVVYGYNESNVTGQATISVGINADDWSGISGNEMLGNYAQNGFGVFISQNVTPFVTMQSTSSLDIYNSDLELLTTSKLPEASLHLARFDPTDYLFSIARTGNIYTLQADGTLNDKNAFNIDTLDIDTYDNAIYILLSGGSVTAFNTHTETTSSFNVSVSSTSICVLDGIPYGFRGTKSIRFQADSVISLVNDNQLILTNVASGDTTTIFRTASSATDVTWINDFAVDLHANIIISYGDKVAMYDSNRVLVFNANLSATLSASNLTMHNIDNIYDIIDGNMVESILCIAYDTNNNTYAIKLDKQGRIITSRSLHTRINTDVKQNITNSAYIQNKYKAKQLQLKLRLTNKLNSRDILVHRYDIDTSNFRSGKHYIALRFDAVQGNVTTFVDGKRVHNFNIPAGKFIFSPIFDTNIALGATQFLNGTTLPSFLRQPNHYMCKGFNIDEIRVYNSCLSDNDVKLLTVRNVNDTILHLPSGQRNNLDKIRRMFAFGTPGMKSNNVKIKIKNSSITNVETRELIKAQILNDVSSIIPAHINILDVEFVEYK